MMKQIHVKNSSKPATVDNRDYDRVVAESWYLNRGRPVIYGMTMARFIMKPKPDQSVKYVSGDPFDNRRNNLKVVAKRELMSIAGAAGGKKKNPLKGFGSDREFAAKMGRIGGRVSIRRKITDSINDVVESGILG